MMKKTLPFLMSLAFVLSGCLGNDDPMPPGASLVADVTEGNAPLNVTFTMDASEVDSTMWTLDLGDSTKEQGDALPASYDHVFEDPGNYTVTFTVGEGDTSDTAELVITVMGETGILQEYSGSWMVTTPVYCAIVGPVNSELSGVLTDNTNVDSDTIGRPFSANFTSEVEAAIVEYTVAFVSLADGFDIIESFTGAPGEPITGTVPENSDQVHFSACGVSGPVDVDYVAG